MLSLVRLWGPGLEVEELGWKRPPRGEVLDCAMCPGMVVGLACRVWIPPAECAEGQI